MIEERMNIPTVDVTADAPGFRPNDPWGAELRGLFGQLAARRGGPPTEKATKMVRKAVRAYWKRPARGPSAGEPVAWGALDGPIYGQPAFRRILREECDKMFRQFPSWRSMAGPARDKVCRLVTARAMLRSEPPGAAR
jgi:hypothetical protein